jgi:hypothetical protein
VTGASPAVPGRRLGNDHSGVDGDFIRSLRMRLEELRRRTELAEEAREAVAATLPEALAVVVRESARPELFIRAQTAFAVAGAAGPLDVAWPAKRIGIRVTGWPRIPSAKSVPDFVHTDAALRDLGWLIFPIDPNSPAAGEHLDRVLSVIRRTGMVRP